MHKLSCKSGMFFILVFGIILISACQVNEELVDEEVHEVDSQPVNPDALENEETDTEIQISEITTGDWEVETLAENLDIPWSLNIHEDVFYMTDREGNILKLEDGQIESSQLQTSIPVAHIGEGGLLGFTLADDFAETKQGFAYYTYQEGSNSIKNRVVKVEKDNEGRWVEIDILLDDIPGARIHNGGRLAMGPDGMLYATTGDAAEPDYSQNVNNLAGSILRMTTTGEIPSDNPIEDSYIYSYGHRNPQGLAWNENGELYSSEHGPTGHDEINLIQPGKNYGWPVIIGDEISEGMENPVIHSGHDTWAPSGISFWGNDLFITGLRGQSLYYFDESQGEMISIFDGEGRLRDVKYYNGAIYLITNNTDGRGSPQSNDDRLLRLTIKNNNS